MCVEVHVDAYEYWGCDGYECKECPHRDWNPDESSPSEFYGCASCVEAMEIDQKLRQAGITEGLFVGMPEEYRNEF